MKKVIKLNENDIESLVKKIIKEDEEDYNECNQFGYNIGHNAAEMLSDQTRYGDLEGSECDNNTILEGFVEGLKENWPDMFNKISIVGGVNEAWPKRELDRKATNFRRGDFEPYKREKDVQSVFGKYSEDVPPQVIQYMRKNPAMIIKRLVDIYGIDGVYDYIDMM